MEQAPEPWLLLAEPLEAGAKTSPCHKKGEREGFFWCQCTQHAGLLHSWAGSRGEKLPKPMWLAASHEVACRANKPKRSISKVPTCRRPAHARTYAQPSLPPGLPGLSGSGGDTVAAAGVLPPYPWAPG